MQMLNASAVYHYYFRSYGVKIIIIFSLMECVFFSFLPVYCKGNLDIAWVTMT